MGTRWYIVFGTPPMHFEQLKQCERSGRSEEWTINSKAQPGDNVAFYMIKPTSAIVAVGVVEDWPEKDRDLHWSGHYMAFIGNIRMLKERIPIRELRRSFPAWGWLKWPQRSTAVPDRFVPRFVKLLRVSSRPVRQLFDLAEQEGFTAESRVTRRGRSRRLRELALERARGVCAACGRNYSTVLGGLGCAVLEVHHRKQLAASRSPRVTRVQDLAVVCANCHRLIHINPRKPIPVEELRRRLQADARRSR
jgi:ribosomal protein L20